MVQSNQWSNRINSRIKSMAESVAESIAESIAELNQSHQSIACPLRTPIAYTHTHTHTHIHTHILLCIESHISPVLMAAIDSFTLFIVIYLFIRENGQGPANKPEGSTFLFSRAARPAGRRCCTGPWPVPRINK